MKSCPLDTIIHKLLQKMLEICTKLYCSAEGRVILLLSIAQGIGLGALNRVIQFETSLRDICATSLSKIAT